MAARFGQELDMTSESAVYSQSNWGDDSKRVKIDVNSIVSGWNYDILTSIIAKLPISQPFGELSRPIM